MSTETSKKYTREEVETLESRLAVQVAMVESLRAEGFTALALYGELEQRERDDQEHRLHDARVDVERGGHRLVHALHHQQVEADQGRPHAGAHIAQAIGPQQPLTGGAAQIGGILKLSGQGAASKRRS